jgi:hypothetical protein
MTPRSRRELVLLDLVIDRAHHLLGTMPWNPTDQESIDFRCLIDRTWETTEESKPTAGIDTGWEHGSCTGILRNTAEARERLSGLAGCRWRRRG